MIKSVNQKLERLLVSTFPDFIERIPKLLLDDQVFREIAEDYMLCRNALEEMENPPEKPRLKKEYRETMLDLEEELHMHLTASKLKNFVEGRKKPDG